MKICDELIRSLRSIRYADNTNRTWEFQTRNKVSTLTSWLWKSGFLHLFLEQHHNTTRVYKLTQSKSTLKKEWVIIFNLLYFCFCFKTFNLFFKVFNTYYGDDSTFVYLLRMEYGWNCTIFGLKMCRKNIFEIPTCASHFLSYFINWGGFWTQIINSVTKMTFLRMEGFQKTTIWYMYIRYMKL